MRSNPDHHYTAFEGDRRLASGPLHDVAVAVKHATHRSVTGPVLIFDDHTGRPLDVDTRGSDAEVIARYAPPLDAPRGRGRPRLGVVAREVTLLPRHWEWLNAQPGGASVTLRQLVEGARRAHPDTQHMRRAHEAAWHFMMAIAGDLPGFEEASRALFANDRARFDAQVAHWPHDVRSHATALGFGRAPTGAGE